MKETSGGWNLHLPPGTSHVVAAAPPDGWWTPTTPTECEVTVGGPWPSNICNFGYWWGLDWSPGQTTTAAEHELTLFPTQDAYVSGWMPGNHGDEDYLRVRQPGVASALLQFDLSTLPPEAEVVEASLWLYSSLSSNAANRLYMTAYPLQTAWTEDQVTWLESSNGVLWEKPGAAGEADHESPVGWSWIDAPGWAEFELDAAVVAGWHADPDSNHGLLMRGEGTENREVAYWFFSKEYEPGDEVHPRLVVGYNAQ